MNQPAIVIFEGNLVRWNRLERRKRRYNAAGKRVRCSAPLSDEEIQAFMKAKS